MARIFVIASSVSAMPALRRACARRASYPRRRTVIATASSRHGVTWTPAPFPGNGAVSGGGDSVALVSDRPEARKALQYMTSAEWFKHSRAHEGGALSAFTDVAPSDYPIPADAAVARVLDDATTFRFDASDRMPGGVGTGVLWKELTAWIGGQSLDATLTHVDAARGS